MKIAVCFSGQPRFIDQMNIDNLISCHNVDIYAHFWWDESYCGQEYACNSSLTYSMNEDPVQKFCSKYPNAKVQFEKYPKIDISDYRKVSRLGFDLSEEIISDSLYRQLSMWTSIKKSISMIEEDYDVVVRTRTDLTYVEKVPLENCTDDGLYFMNGSLQAGVGREYCDWFFCGPLHRMKQFDVLPTFREFNIEGLMHMHELVQYSLHRYAIPHCTPDLKVWILDRSKHYAEFQK